MISGTAFADVLNTAAAGAVATGVVSALLLLFQNRHDANERAVDRQAVERVAREDRDYANLMKLQLSVTRHVNKMIIGARVLAQQAQNYRIELGEEKNPVTEEEFNLSFLLADDELASLLMQFDSECVVFFRWCESRKNNSTKTSTDEWKERASEKADLITNLAEQVVGAQRRRVGLQPWAGFRDVLKIDIPDLVEMRS